MKSIYNQKIIDTHHHLWDPNSGKYDWLLASGHEIFNHKYLINDFTTDFENLNIFKSVHIQAEINLSEIIYETEWLQRLSEKKSLNNKNNLPNAIIGFANFLDSNVENILEKHLQSPNFRGIRHILNYDSNNPEISHTKIDYLNEDLWLKNFSLLTKYDLSFDLSILLNQTDSAAKLINKNQNILFIINHTLSPFDIGIDNIDIWLDKIKTLSSFDNVAIKLSGFGEFNPYWNEESIKPLILHSINFFGIEKCMFGTNFPVDKFLSKPSYVDYWKTYMNIVKDFTESEIDNLFYKNAEIFYKI